MTYSHEVEHMCVVKKGPNHGPAPIPEEGKWVKAKEIVDISDRVCESIRYVLVNQEVILPTPCLRLGRILPCLWQSFANAVAKSCQW